MAEYTPGDDQVRTAWHQYATATDAEYARLREDDDHPAHEFDRFLARVRRDAARERFEDFIANVQTMHDGTHLHAGRIVYAEVIRLAEVYVKHHLPETED